jgi:DNA-binding transcriptional ArsR family regulator
MSGETTTDDAVFKALADHRRRAMLDMLRDNPMTTGALAKAFPDLHRCTVMQHLGVLAAAGLVIVRRAGRERWNHLNVLPIRDIHERWIGDYAAHAVEMLARLKQQMEAGPEA